MIPRLVAARAGTAAIEFALVAPIFLTVCLGACALGLSAWQWSTLETVAASTARCVAIASPDCTNAAPACASQDSGVCYALRLAEKVGISDLGSDEVEIDRQSLAGTMPVVRVDVTHAASLVGYRLPLRVSASFPLP